MFGLFDHALRQRTCRHLFSWKTINWAFFPNKAFALIVVISPTGVVLIASLCTCQFICHIT